MKITKPKLSQISQTSRQAHKRSLELLIANEAKKKSGLLDDSKAVILISRLVQSKPSPLLSVKKTTWNDGPGIDPPKPHNTHISLGATI